MKKLINRKNIISLISISITIILMIFIIKLNIIPLKYITLFGLIIFIINILGIIIINLNKKILKLVGYSLLIIISILNIILSYYLINTNKFINKSFEKVSNEYKTTYYVITNKNSSYNSLKDIKNKTINYYKEEIDIDKAYNNLSKKIFINNNKYEDISVMFNDLKSNSIDIVLVSKSLYELIFSIDTNLSNDDYKILYKYDITTKFKNESVSNKDVFNIFIGGKDFTNNNMDFNMIITVNTKSHKILLTSIPRDYYIEVDGYNKKDTLSYMGALGINTNLKSLEEFFGINIDYYLSIKTNSLVSLVDEVGGINYCSEHDYITTHSLILDSYDDSKGKKLHVIKGCQHLNGIETLTVARERKKFPGSDVQRQKNCQAIIMDIFAQLKSINTITNYNNILNSVSELYETTIPKKIVINIIKDTLASDSKWNFENQIVTGEDTKDKVHMTDLIDWVMYPDMNSVNSAKEKIIKVSNN